MDKEKEQILATKKTAAAMRREYISGIADHIKSLIFDDGFAANDIMVLVQRRAPFAGPLIRELKSRGIDVAGSDRINLPQFPAVRDLLNLIRFCIDTTDDYSLCCVLKSPLFCMTHDDIYLLCHNRTASVFENLETIRPTVYAELREIVEQSKILAPYSFFTNVLNKKRDAMITALGTQIIDPLEEFMTICLAYERTQPGTLRHFLKWFIIGGSEIKRDMDANFGVRVATVHGSKGLEAPVVFLIDTMRTPRDKPDNIVDIDNAFLWSPRTNNSEKWNMAAESAMDKKIAEYYRLLYVAMTRARDRLYIYGFTANKNAPEIAWHTKLYNIMSKHFAPDLTDGILRISNVPNE